ncbi:MAG TPA: glycosyltransferase family 2 protein [Bacteroidales bacterium]|nr:glycosyltransferase family 2 protein [Bacteroidales bacterium]
MNSEIHRIITNEFCIEPEKSIAPKVSIITVNYRQSDITNSLLQSLEQVDMKSFEVIVVNNSETDDYKNIICPTYTLRIIVSKVNKGFAAANNLGFTKARGEYILLLNNDTEVDPAFLDEMIEAFQWKKRIGAVSPKIKYFSNPLLIQYAGYSKMNPFTLRMRARGSKEPDNGSYNERLITNYGHGCAMMVRRGVLEEVGPMPEQYFLYYEEHDWSSSIRKAGYDICYEPGAVVYHKESVTVRKDSPMKVYYMNRNRFLFMRRNLTAFQKLISTTYMLLFSIPVNTLKYFVRRQNRHLRAYLEAVIYGITGRFHIPWKASSGSWN